MHTIKSKKLPWAADHRWNTPCDANITDEMWNSCTFLCKNHDYFYCIADICSTNAGSLQNTKLLSLQRFRAMHGRNIHFFPESSYADTVIVWDLTVWKFEQKCQAGRVAGGCQPVLRLTVFCKLGILSISSPQSFIDWANPSIACFSSSKLIRLCGRWPPLESMVLQDCNVYWGAKVLAHFSRALLKSPD